MLTINSIAVSSLLLDTGYNERSVQGKGIQQYVRRPNTQLAVLLLLYRVPGTAVYSIHPTVSNDTSILSTFEDEYSTM